MVAAVDRRAPRRHTAGCAVDQLERSSVTAAKCTTRRRRTSGSSIPRPVAAWLAGLAPRPFDVLAFPGYALLPFDWWPTWAAENPRAVPPAGYAWLADPTDSRHRIYPPVLRSARNCGRRMSAAATSPPPAR